MYPPEQFIALDDGEIVADAVSFDELTKELGKIGKDRADIFVVQVDVDYPEEVFILVENHIGVTIWSNATRTEATMNPTGLRGAEHAGARGVLRELARSTSTLSAGGL